MSTYADIILAEAAFILVKMNHKKKRWVWVKPSSDRRKYNGNRMLADYIQDPLIGFGPGEGIRSTFQSVLNWGKNSKTHLDAPLIKILATPKIFYLSIINNTNST